MWNHISAIDFIPQIGKKYWQFWSFDTNKHHIPVTSMLSLFRVLLLVAALGVGIAHARTFTPSAYARILVTSPLPTKDALESSGGYSYVRQNLLSLGEDQNDKRNEDESVPVRASPSVVQDWSLVCQQLCGAGLGGQLCASAFNCSAIDIPDLRVRNANALLKSNKALICKDLCALQLGDVSCDCASDSVKVAEEGRALTDERNSICNTFCTHSRTTLAGCSLCNVQLQLDLVVDADGGQTHGNGGAGAGAVGGRAANLDVIVTSTAATTPDWNELCASLCKTGDGGSLCNCDLSPFFY